MCPDAPELSAFFEEIKAIRYKDRPHPRYWNSQWVAEQLQRDYAFTIMKLEGTGGNPVTWSDVADYHDHGWSMVMSTGFRCVHTFCETARNVPKGAYAETRVYTVNEVFLTHTENEWVDS